MRKKKNKQKSVNKLHPDQTKKIKWLHIFLITITCFVVFSNTLKNEFVYDDKYALAYFNRVYTCRKMGKEDLALQDEEKARALSEKR